jgi:hypothetical protein
MANGKAVASKRSTGGKNQEKGYFKAAIDQITNPNNRSLLISVGMFAVCGLASCIGPLF